MHQNDSDIARSVHLTASAGSGKTRALKERYLALLQALDAAGLSAEQAVAITFTDRAAAEIKERVMRDLPEPMLKKIIRGNQDLRISTIHSFCMNLLKRYPLEAAVPPDFGILNTRDQADKIDRAVTDTLEAADRDPSLMASFDTLSADRLANVVTQLFSTRSKLNRIAIDAGGAEGFLRLARNGVGIEQALSDMEQLLAGVAWRTVFRDMEQELRLQHEAYEDCKGREHALLSGAATVDQARPLVASIRPCYFTKIGTPAKRPAITKNRFLGTRREQYESLYFSAQTLLDHFLSLDNRIRSGQRAVSLLRLFLTAEERYREIKFREGVLDFDDLEICAYRLLMNIDSPDILYWLDRRILHFLVDEFQDTSDIQWAVLNKLTEELFSGRGADKPMRPTLFLVGDEKQSIYRFREANYRLMESVRMKMESGMPEAERNIRTLEMNYRSTPEIVEIVNSVFGNLWPESFHPARPSRLDQRGSVCLIEIPASAESGSSALSEPDALANELKTMIVSGIPVYDSESAAVRPARYDDCAILIQSRTRLKDFEAALRRESIPFRVVGGIGFFEEDEIQALMNVLFFLNNADDRLALASALKSPLFGLTDRELYAVARAEGDPLAVLETIRHEAASLIRSWSALAGLVPLPLLLHRVVSESGAYIRFGRRNPQAIFNIDKLLDTSREFDRRGYTTLQDFSAWVRSIRQSEQREATADMNLPEFRGAVSIMTVHKAKGLEFPIVFLPGLNQKPQSLSRGPAVLFAERGGLTIAVRDPANGFYDELWQAEQDELRREQQRLLYVAMTRSRDHLIMLGSLEDQGEVKPDTWLSYLHTAAPAGLFGSRRDLPNGIRLYRYPGMPDFDTQQLPPAQNTAKILTAVTARFEVPASDVIMANLAPVAASGSRDWRRATDFIEREPSSSLLRSQSALIPDSISPLIRGSVLHRCLEDHAKSGSYDVNAVVAAQPELRNRDQEVVNRFVKSAQVTLDAVLNNPELAWIFDPSLTTYAELPFLYKREGSFVSGIIDRIVVRDGKAYIIDYKAILIESDEALAAWNDHYRPQVRIYCEAAQEIFRVPSAEGFLLYLDSNRLEKVVSLS